MDSVSRSGLLMRWIFGVSYDSPYEHQGCWDWNKSEYEYALEQAVEVFMGECRQPMIPIYSKPKIDFAIERDEQGNSKDIKSRFCRDVDSIIRNGRK